MEYENAFNFLLYSYFGITGGVEAIRQKENKEKITELCAYRAYLDLARTVKFQYATSNLEKMKKRTASQNEKDEAEKFIDRKEKLIEELCKSILQPVGMSQCVDSQFPLWHKEKCNNIKTQMNNGNILMNSESFTYGQAQKWVNMTLKYLWLLEMLPDGLSESSLHVPIDSYILQKLKKEKVDGVTGSGEIYYYNGQTWSKLDDDDCNEYRKLQEAIKTIAEQKNMTPIAWEGPAWIEVAEDRKK